MGSASPRAAARPHGRRRAGLCLAALAAGLIAWLAAAGAGPAPASARDGGFDGAYRGQITVSNPVCGKPQFEFTIADGRLSLPEEHEPEAGDVLAVNGRVDADGRLNGTFNLGPFTYKMIGDLKDGKASGAVYIVRVMCGGIIYEADVSWRISLVEGRVADAAPKENAKEPPATTPAKPPRETAASKAEPKPAEAKPRPAESAAAANGEALETFSQSLGNFVALIIGNDKYQHLPALKTATADATALAALLETRYGFRTKVLKNATRRDILAALAGLRSSLKYDDNLLIYYAGHGQLDEITERGYWLPVDAEADNPANWVSNADVTDMLKALPSRAVLVIADSCYAGTLTRSIVTPAPPGADRRAFLERVSGKRARTVLASGGLEPVADSGGGKHSVFSKALIDILSENDQVIDAQSLFAPIRQRVVLNAEQTPEYADVRLAGHEGGEFIFVPR